MPTRFEATHEIDPATWDGYVADLGAPVFHSHAWATFVCRERGGMPIFARWLDARGDVAALAVGSLRSPFTGRLASQSAAAFFDALPAVAADPAAASIEPLAAWARRNGALSLNLGSLEGGGRRWGGQVDDGEERIEFVVSPADRSELLRRMRTMARRGARRAERHGVVIERGLEGDTPVFARLFESTIARLKRDKDIHVGRFDKQRFASNLAMLITSQHGRLYLARLEDDYVGGCFFGVAGTSAYYLYNGSTESALRVGATPLTLLQAMTDFSEEAFTRINLGGVPASARQETSPDHGLYEFKLGLGTEPVECHGGRVRLRPVRLKLLDVASSLRARTQ